MPGATHLTRSLEEAEALIARLMDEEVDVIFAGGGDGTIVQIINSVMREAARRGTQAQDLPMLSILPFGTGNALASHLELDSALRDLARIQNGAPTEVQRLNLLRCGGQLSPFAGMGVDAMIVNDYNDLKKSVQGKPMGKMLTGLRGYFASIFGRTLPRALDPRFHFPQVSIINQGARAYRVDQSGRRVEAYEPGDVLYQGPALVAAASTVHCYGFNLRLFPFAQQHRERFHLRLYSGGPLEPALHIPHIFAGTFRSDHLHDFLAQDVVMRFDEKMPVQIGGDAHGWEKEMHISLSPDPLPVLTPQRKLLN
jgi:diacylglycerol kinase family enzyme